MSYLYTPLTERERESAACLARELRVSPVLVEILYRRNIIDAGEVREFLFPQLANLPDPFCMLGMQKAITRIVRARLSGHPVYIHGDYDVDGITATTLLQAFFTEAGIASSYYIPKRTEEHYGLSEISLERLLGGTRPQMKPVLVTVDCGISSLKEVKLAQKRYGCDVIITDHHLPGKDLPEALAILNPKQQDCHFPYKALAGVGVAFFLILGLRRALVEAGVLSRENLPNLKRYLDLVALGSIADVVPLTGVNRTLVRAGLEVLASRKRAGIVVLAANANVMTSNISSEDVSFRLAPRINACGRLGEPELGVQLLLARELKEAECLAAKLEHLNIRRKSLENSMLPDIEDACSKQIAAGRAAIAVYNAACHPGILGILASRMAERFNVPVILFTSGGDAEGATLLKGSGRSIPGLNLYEALGRCRAAIEQFGGHPMAAGLTVELGQLEHFAQLFHESVEKASIDPNSLHNKIRVDYQFNASYLLQHNLLPTIQLMEPCGVDNPEPVFLLKQEKLQQVHTIGNNEHVTFQIQMSGRRLAGIGFHLAQQYASFEGNETALLFRLRQRWIRGREYPQMDVLQFLPTLADPAEN